MVLLVVVASLRCVRAQRRRARSGKDGATWHPVSTLLALRKKQLRYKLQQLLVRLLRMQVCRVQPLRRSKARYSRSLAWPLRRPAKRSQGCAKLIYPWRQIP